MRMVTRGIGGWGAILASAGLAIGGAGCAQPHEALRREGRSAFRFVQPEPPPGMGGGLALAVADPSQRYVPAKPRGDLARPAFPEAARVRLPLPAIVAVNITVGLDGRVEEVRDSRTRFSTPGPFAAEFRAAVEAALARWAFEPAEVLWLETVADPSGDFQRVKSREKVTAFAEVVFTFTSEGEILTER